MALPGWRGKAYKPLARTLKVKLPDFVLNKSNEWGWPGAVYELVPTVL